MAVRRGGGAFAALALAGLAYFFKNRKQVSSKVQQLTSRAQQQIGGPSVSTPSTTTTTTTTDPRAYTGDTVRM